mgnify:CR=1 FL=1
MLSALIFIDEKITCTPWLRAISVALIAVVFFIGIDSTTYYAEKNSDPIGEKFCYSQYSAGQL